MKMTSLTPGHTVKALNVRKTLKGEVLNAFKTGSGRVLKKPIVIETEEGTWCITKITRATWIGPAVISAHVEVLPPMEIQVGTKTARFELDFRMKDHDAELVITRSR